VSLLCSLALLSNYLLWFIHLNGLAQYVIYITESTGCLRNWQVTAVHCPSCTRTLAVAQPLQLLQLAIAAHEECLAEHSAAILRVKRCTKQLEMYQKDAAEASLYVEEVTKGLKAIRAYVEVERASVTQKHIF
jgi:hypothetical protein